MRYRSGFEERGGIIPEVCGHQRDSLGGVEWLHGLIKGMYKCDRSRGSASSGIFTRKHELVRLFVVA